MPFDPLEFTRSLIPQPGESTTMTGVTTRLASLTGQELWEVLPVMGNVTSAASAQPLAGTFDEVARRIRTQDTTGLGPDLATTMRDLSTSYLTVSAEIANTQAAADHDRRTRFLGLFSKARDEILDRRGPGWMGKSSQSDPVGTDQLRDVFREFGETANRVLNTLRDVGVLEHNTAHNPSAGYFPRPGLRQEVNALPASMTTLDSLAEIILRADPRDVQAMIVASEPTETRSDRLLSSTLDPYRALLQRSRQDQIDALAHPENAELGAQASRSLQQNPEQVLSYVAAESEIAAFGHRLFVGPDSPEVIHRVVSLVRDVATYPELVSLGPGIEKSVAE